MMGEVAQESGRVVNWVVFPGGHGGNEPTWSAWWDQQLDAAIVIRRRAVAVRRTLALNLPGVCGLTVDYLSEATASSAKLA